MFAVGHSEFECITVSYINEAQLILYLDEKPFPCTNVARKQNQISNVTRDGYTTKMQYVLAPKTTVEQRGEEARSLEQVWSWHRGCLDNMNESFFSS